MSEVDYLALAGAGVQKLRPYEPGKPVEALERELVEAIVRELGGELSAHVLADALAHGRAEPTCDAQRVHSQKGVPLRLVESDPHAQERQVPYCVGAKLKASEGREATHVLRVEVRVSARVSAHGDAYIET